MSKKESNPPSPRDAKGNIIKPEPPPKPPKIKTTTLDTDNLLMLGITNKMLLQGWKKAFKDYIIGL